MQAFIPLQETADVEVLLRGPLPPGLPPLSCPGLSLSWAGALSAPPKVVILNTPFSINKSQHDDIASPSLVSVNSPFLIFNKPCTLLVVESYPRYVLVCKASPFEVTLESKVSKRDKGLKFLGFKDSFYRMDFNIRDNKKSIFKERSWASSMMIQS